MKFWKEHSLLRLILMAATFVLGMILAPKKTLTIGSNNSGNGCNCSNTGLIDTDEEAEA